LGGEIQVQWKPKGDIAHKKVQDAGLSLDRVYKTDDLISGDVCTFTATGIQDGPLLKGVEFRPHDMITTHSVVMRSATGTVRWIEAEHRV